MIAKDIFLCSLDRIYNFKNYHIIQEMEVRDGVAIAEVENAVLRTKTVNEEGFADADVREQATRYIEYDSEMRWGAGS